MIPRDNFSELGLGEVAAPGAVSAGGALATEVAPGDVVVLQPAPTAMDCHCTR